MQFYIKFSFLEKKENKALFLTPTSCIKRKVSETLNLEHEQI